LYQNIFCFPERSTDPIGCGRVPSKLDQGAYNDRKQKMSERDTNRKFLHALRSAVGAAAVVILAAPAAHAALVMNDLNADFSMSPVTIDLGGGLASYTFSYLGYDGSSYTVDAVSTGGTALVNSSGFPGPGQQPIPFEIDTAIGANGYDTFTAFSKPAGIAYSIAEDFIGLKFGLADGDHFGYAEVLGPTLVRYGYETIAGASAITGADATPVSEPGSLALALGGLAVLGGACLARRRGTAMAAC
jgi:hypothetical protein